MESRNTRSKRWAVPPEEGEKWTQRMKTWCHKRAMSPNFELSNALAIIVNAIVLGLNWWVEAAAALCLCARA